MYKNLILALALAAGCAHAPAPAAPVQVAAADAPAPAAPCVLVEPPNLLEHQMALMAEPEEVKETTPSGHEVPVLRFRILAPSATDFFVTARVLNDWAQATWKSCGGGAR